MIQFQENGWMVGQSLFYRTLPATAKGPIKKSKRTQKTLAKLTRQHNGMFSTTFDILNFFVPVIKEDNTKRFLSKKYMAT